MGAPRAPEAAGRAARIAVTRPAGSAGELAELLREGGAEPVVLPLTRIVPPRDDHELRAAVGRLPEYDWVVFTSVNAVHAMAGALRRGDQALRPRAVAAVGTATALAVTDLLGWSVSAIPPEFTAAALVPTLSRQGLAEGAVVLWPRAEHARTTLSRALDEAGVRLDAPVAYATEPETGNARTLARRVERGELDAIVFTAPSAIAAYAAAEPRGRVVHAVIGPSTAEAARAHGLEVHVQPPEHTIAALARTLLDYLAVGRAT